MGSFEPGSQIHMIGIAGSGMSGIAEILAARGFIVTGSDEKESATLRSLASRGIRTFVGHEASQIGDATYVVISSAIRDSNPELIAARQRGIEIVRRASALARLLPGKFSIAVAGTHGKTTTSAIFAHMLDALDRDPSFVIGSKVTSLGTSAREGHGEVFVVEADESDGSFLDYKPDGAIITNVELDHVDNFSSIDDIIQLFTQFIATVKDFVVICDDDPSASRLHVPDSIRRITYGRSSSCDLFITEIEDVADGISAKVQFQGGNPLPLRLSVHGIHNALNAAAVVASAAAMGIDLSEACRSVAGFLGTSRRFEVKGSAAGITIIDDYGHHPTEIEATIATARSTLAAKRLQMRGQERELGHEQEKNSGRLCVIFQPHRYSRTAAFADGFSAALSQADRSIVLGIYSAGEDPIAGASSQVIADKANNSIHLLDEEDVIADVTKWARAGDLILTLGAGDITELGPKLLTALKFRD